MGEFRGFFKTHFVADIGQIRDKLTEDLTKAKRESGLVAIVFAIPKKPFVKNEVLPLVEIWNYRSKDYVTFFFVGWQGVEDVDDSEFSDVFLDKNNPEGSFSAKTFDEAIEEFQGMGPWRYKGDTPLILCRGYLRYRKQTNEPRAFLDLESVIEFELERALREGSIDSVESFFEVVIRVAKEAPGDVVHWRLSDQLGNRALGDAIIEAITEKVKGAKRILNAIKFFRVKA